MGVGNLMAASFHSHSSGRLNRDWEHGTLQWADEHAVFVVFDVPCRSWSGFDIMATDFFSALKGEELQVGRGGAIVQQ
jgi:hypothetical protein